MKRLTRKEEELMKIIWELKKAFLKDVIEEYPDPKPHYNTIATIARTLLDKKVLDYKQYGNTYQYFPLISKEEYRKSTINRMMADYFDDSYKNLVAFFVKEKGITDEQLDDLVKYIKEQK